jgi:uncharacterized protein YbjT (DUF2867 family)
MTFAVAGASGHSGRVAAETLLARGAKVRVVLRDAAKAAEWTARGAEVALADFGDAPALTRALAGTAGAYLLIPPHFTAPSQREHQQAVARALAAAVAESGVPRVVFLSAFAAHRGQSSGPIAGLHDAEGILGAVPGVRLTAIRAGYLYENLGPLLATVRDAGMLPSFFPAALPIPMVGTRDVGLLAARLLLDETDSGPIVEIGSDRTHGEIAALLCKLLGKPIGVAEIALDAITPLLIGLGFTPDLAGLYVEMIAGIRSGALAFEGGHRRVEASSSLETLLASLLGAPSK